MLKKLFLLCAVLFTAATAMAQVETITINFTPGAGGEASIKYMGINGNEELNKLVPVFIKASGWLKQVSSSADFDLRGVANSTTCEYIVSVGNSRTRHLQQSARRSKESGGCGSGSYIPERKCQRAMPE